MPLYSDALVAQAAAASAAPPAKEGVTPLIPAARWQLLLDGTPALARSESCNPPPAPVVSSSAASTGPTPSWPPNGFLLSTLGPATSLETAAAHIRDLVASAMIASDTAHSLADVPGDFNANLAAASAELGATCSLIVLDAARCTVRVKGLGMLAVLKGEAALLIWINRAVAAARAEEAAHAAVLYPPEWEDGPFDPTVPGCTFKDVAPGSAEHASVVASLKTRPDGSGPVFSKAVLRVQRVQNPLAWAGYSERLKAIAKLERNKGSPNEL